MVINETPDETTDEDLTIFHPTPPEPELLHQHVTTVARSDTSAETAERDWQQKAFQHPTSGLRQHRTPGSCQHKIPDSSRQHHHLDIHLDPVQKSHASNVPVKDTMPETAQPSRRND